MAISLDAQSLRQEIQDRGSFTDNQVEALTALPDNELEDAVQEVVNDFFWEAYDSTRSDAITWLLRRHNLGDEGEED